MQSRYEGGQDTTGITDYHDSVVIYEATQDPRMKDIIANYFNNWYVFAFWFILVYFDLFWFFLVYFFWFTLICFGFFG